MRIYLTKKEVLRDFKESVLPCVKAQYEQDGIRDKPARSEAWCNYVDSLERMNAITETQASNWSNPF